MYNNFFKRNLLFFLEFQFFRIIFVQNLKKMQDIVKLSVNQSSVLKRKGCTSWTKVERLLPLLRQSRWEQVVTFADYCELDFATVKSIESGGAYSFTSLFKYMNTINCYLKVDGNRVYSLQDLGAYLSNYRKLKAGIRVFAQRCGISPGAVLNIEKGRGFSKSVFIKYLSHLGTVDFGIDEVTF